MLPAMWEAAVTLRDGLGPDDVVFLAGVATSVMTICAFIWWATKPARVAAAHWGQFWEDWNGTPASPGRDPVPGVMERLQRMDGELKRNGGASLKDRVFEIDRKLDRLAAAKEAEHSAIRADLAQLHQTIDEKGRDC